MRKKLMFLLILISMSQYNFLWAYDGEVHMEIDNNATESSQLGSVLKNQLGMDNGIKSILKKGKIEKRIKEWIAYGGAAEDYGKWGGGDKWYNIPCTRGYNHFHDPLKDWDEAGFDKPGLNEIYQLCYGRHPVSSILWGLHPEMQNFSENTTGDWSWGNARDYFYDALRATSADERKQNFADCFRALGQVMHLLQDASVPLHTRNDFHTPVFYNIEAYTKEYLKDQGEHKLDFIPDQPSDRPDPRLLQVPAIIPDPNYPDMVPVSGLFDRNAYNDPGPIPSSNILGMAEYSNANFLTEDTMWIYQHPSLEDTNHDRIDWLNPVPVDAEDGKVDKRIYIKKTAGEVIDHFAVADYWTFEYGEYVSYIPGAFSLDKECWKDYAAKLIPRAVGYSAGLLNYFFRGRLHVKLLSPSAQQAIDDPYHQNDAGKDIGAIAVNLQNNTKKADDTIEPIGEGILTLTVSYTDTSTGETLYKSAGSFTVDTIPAIGSGSFWAALFTFEDPIITDYIEDITYYLAFKGQLGNEDGAVIGKVLKGPLLYSVSPNEGIEETEVTLTVNSLPLLPDDIRFYHDATKPYNIEVIDQTDTEITVKVPDTAFLKKPGYGGLRIRYLLDTEEEVLSNPVPFFPIAEGLVTNIEEDPTEDPIDITLQATGPIQGDYNQLPETITIEDLNPGASGQIQLMTGFTYRASANITDTQDIWGLTPDDIDFIFEVK